MSAVTASIKSGSDLISVLSQSHPIFGREDFNAKVAAYHATTSITITTTAVAVAVAVETTTKSTTTANMQNNWHILLCEPRAKSPREFVCVYLKSIMWPADWAADLWVSETIEKLSGSARSPSFIVPAKCSSVASAFTGTARTASPDSWGWALFNTHCHGLSHLDCVHCGHHFHQ